MALRHHFRTGNDKGFTLVEIIAVLVILMLVLPAIYTSYTTAARTSELALLRLRCLGIARQELEYRKSLGYDKLNTGLDDEQPKVESFTTPDGIKVVTTLERIKVVTTLESTTVDTDTEKDSNAVRVTVEAGTRSMNVEIVALVVEGGF